VGLLLCEADAPPCSAACGVPAGSPAGLVAPRLNVVAVVALSETLVWWGSVAGLLLVVVAGAGLL
jgi:hypothetical protein